MRKLSKIIIIIVTLIMKVIIITVNIKVGTSFN